jgi:hypothetical protein
MFERPADELDITEETDDSDEFENYTICQDQLLSIIVVASSGLERGLPSSL